MYTVQDTLQEGIASGAQLPLTGFLYYPSSNYIRNEGFIVKFTHGLNYWWAEVGTLSIIAIIATLRFYIIVYTLFLTLSENAIASISSIFEHIGGVLF